MKEKRNDIYSGIAMIIFAIFLFVGSYWIQPTTSDILGSRFFPKAIAVLIVLLAVIQIIGSVSYLKQNSSEQDTAKEADQEQEQKDWKNKPLIMTTIALFVYYVVILQVGFVITSIIYLLFQGAVLMNKEDLKDKKKMAVLVLVAVLVPIFINTIFWRVFTIALPSGKLF